MAHYNLCRAIAVSLAAIANCERSGNDEWRERHQDRIVNMVREKLPSGSGFDAGTTLDFMRSTPERLVFKTSFHHMHELGHYLRWTEHEVIVTPSFVSEIDIRVTGRDYRDIKDYIGDSFHHVLVMGGIEPGDFDPPELRVPSLGAGVSA